MLRFAYHLQAGPGARKWTTIPKSGLFFIRMDGASRLFMGRGYAQRIACELLFDDPIPLMFCRFTTHASAIFCSSVRNGLIIFLVSYFNSPSDCLQYAFMSVDKYFCQIGGKSFFN